MKQQIIKLLLFIFISVLPVSAGTFKVEDPVLEEIIREQLQIDEDNEITLDDISQLVEISNFIEIEGPNNTSTFKQVKSFKGLETAENIKIFNYMIFLDNPGLPVAIDNLNSWNLDTIFIKSNNGYERENKIFEEETVKLINEITNTAPLKLVEASYKTEDFSFLEGIDLNQRGIETLSYIG